MNKIILCCALLFLQLQLISGAKAADENVSAMQTCLDMQNKESVENELNCYRKVAKEPLPARGLAQEWAPTNNPLNQYKQTYVLLYSLASQPNNAPTSPNPLNQALTPTQLDNRDLKFQISFKHDLVDFTENSSLWFGYTQLSFWQVYDQANSRPFRESNYEPEFIYSYRPDNWQPIFGLTASVFNAGVVHQSNGQSNPRSRSWNRVYVQSGLEHDFEHDRKISVLLRYWQRLNENLADDDNPDITNYLGSGDIEVRYMMDRQWEISALGRIRSIQIDLAAPWTVWHWLSSLAPGKHSTNIHVQYFNGYGESLIDYNQSHTTWGVGLSFPFE